MLRGEVSRGVQFVESIQFLGPVNFDVCDAWSRHGDIEVPVVRIGFGGGNDGFRDELRRHDVIWQVGSLAHGDALGLRWGGGRHRQRCRGQGPGVFLGRHVSGVVVLGVLLLLVLLLLLLLLVVVMELVLLEEI